MEKFKKMFNKFERWMMAAAYAEAGDTETAIQLITPEHQKKQQQRKKIRVVNRTDHRRRLEL